MVLEVVFDEKVKKLGFEIGLEDERTCVTGVKPGSEAHKRDLRAGDVLVKLNGVAITRPGRDELKAMLKERPLTLQIDRPEAKTGGGSDSGSESDDGKGSPLAARLDHDLALLSAAKAKAASVAKTKGGYAAAGPSQPVGSKAEEGDSGEDSAEEPKEEQVRPDRFDRDMDLLHKRMKPPTTGVHAKALDVEDLPQVKGPETAAQEAEDEAFALQLQEDLLKETEDDAAIAEHLQQQEDQTSTAPPASQVIAATRPRPDLLAAASAVAAAREEERLADVEDDDEESWAEEEVERTSSKGAMQIKVRVPEGCRPGDTLEVVSPTGDLIHVVIPDGHGPGSLLLVQVQNRIQAGPQNMLYSSLSEKHSLGDWEVILQKLVAGYSVIKVARNGKLYERNFWLAGGSLRTNGRFSSGVDLRQLTGVFRGAVSQEFLRLKKASAAPRKSTSTLGSSLLRTFVAKKPAAIEHPDPDEAGVVIIATGGRSFSLLFPGGRDEREEFAEGTTFAVQRLRREMGRPCKF